MIKIKNDLLEEKNIIQDYSNTFFYITTITNPIRYGVAVNVKDKNQMKEIIEKMRTERKEQIESWNEEQRQRNLKIQGGINLNMSF